MIWTKRAALLGAIIAFPQPAAAVPVVKTDSGRIQGKQVPGLNVFLGIPFAQPPVGGLRWRDPQPVKSWSGTRDATRMSAACMQEAAKPFGPYSSEFLIGPDVSEDCLYLNVWASNASRLPQPVFLFIHGGAFQAGGSSVPIYDGARLARRGAVVVTINYRLGIFGFLAHPELTKESSLGTSGNYGLLDMIAALRWVRSNIARFGGDPTNVTIAGQSAGAIAVNDLLASPLAQGLFHRAIAESGPTIGRRMKPLDVVESAGQAFLARLNETSMVAVRAKPATQVLIAFRGPGISMPPFRPTPVLDRKVVISDPEIASSPIVSKVPLIVGFNGDEAQVPATTTAKFVNSVRAQYGALADRFLTAYPHGSDAEATRSAGELDRDARFARLLDWAQRRALASGQRVFVYRFEHAYPGTDIKRFGSFHTAEVPYVFGVLDKALGQVTAKDVRVVEQMQARWLAFSKWGDPSLPGSEWRDILNSGGRVMYLGDSPGPRAPLSPARLALFEEFLAEKSAE